MFKFKQQRPYAHQAHPLDLAIFKGINITPLNTLDVALLDDFVSFSMLFKSVKRHSIGIDTSDLFTASYIDSVKYSGSCSDLISLRCLPTRT